MKRWIRLRGASLVTAIMAAAACGGETQGSRERLGGETNWLGGCDSTSECAEGECICGICTASCTSDPSCSVGGSALCVTPGGLLFQATCGDEPTADTGVCLGRCESDADCAGGTACVGGACLPQPQSEQPSRKPQTGSYRFFNDLIVQRYASGAPVSDVLMGRCLPNRLPVDDTGSAPCVVLEAAAGGCECDGPGRRAASAPEAALAAKRLALAGVCGRPETPSCQDMCLCVLEEATGDARTACLSSEIGPEFNGWCYVDPAQNIGAPELVEQCPLAQKRLLRVGRPMAPLTALVLACASEHAEVGPSAGAAAEIGAPCISFAEHRTDFGGASEREITIDVGSSMCESGICLGHAFRGRVECPYGNESGGVCETPGGELVSAAVPAQILERAPEDAVVCSCRCDGPDPNGEYCECPSGFECREAVADIGFGSSAVAGSYCVKAGTWVERVEQIVNTQDCQPGECG